MRRPWGLGAFAATAVLVGCLPVAAPVDEEAPVPAPPGGPTLVLNVVNRSAKELEVSYEFSAPGSEGEGIGPFPACEVGMMPFGMVVGAYRVLIDGEEIHDDEVPARLAARDGWVILRVVVDADGTARAVGDARWSEVEPVHRTTPLAGCG